MNTDKNRIFLAVLIAAGLIIGAWLMVRRPDSSPDRSLGCRVQEITFYYLDQCGWCQKVKSEGTIDKIESLGVKVNQINANSGLVRHNFQAVPTFVIDGRIYEGYKTFEEIKELLDCSEEGKEDSGSLSVSGIAPEFEFFGEKGESLVLESGETRLDADIFSDNRARFFNTKMPGGKTIYFFAVKDKNGVYRAAANACAVCFKTYKGFRQEGNEMVCNNCGNRYPVEKIATEKGGCNPGPINPNLEIRNGEIIIKQTDLEQVLDLF